jgi:hypothetical protein
MPLFLHLFLFLYNRYIHTSLIHSLTFAEAHLYCCWLCAGARTVWEVWWMWERSQLRELSHLLPSQGRLRPPPCLHQQVSVPPAPVPGAVPATRPPASTGQCPTCSRPRGGSSHPPACINRSVSHLLPSPGRLQPPSRLHQQVSVAPK